MRTGISLNLKIHLAGHSTGGILLAHLLEALAGVAPRLRISTCSLMAPAATMALYRRHFQSRLADPAQSFGIDRMTIYNLSDELERDDHVARGYRKSLLYLESRTFEEETPAPILGMQRYRQVPEGSSDRLQILYSHGDRDREAATLSTRQGGFDNDPATLNHMLERILGRRPKRPFTESDLNY